MEGALTSGNPYRAKNAFDPQSPDCLTSVSAGSLAWPRHGRKRCTLTAARAREKARQHSVDLTDSQFDHSPLESSNNNGGCLRRKRCNKVGKVSHFLSLSTVLQADLNYALR